MVRSLIPVAMYGSLATVLVGAVAVLGLEVAYARVRPTISFSDIELAVVREFEGSPSLDEILRSQGFELKTLPRNQWAAAMDSRPTIYLHKALANACSSDQFAQDAFCLRYAEIPKQLGEQRAAQQAAFQAKYDWILPTQLGLLATCFAGVVGAVGLSYLDTKPANQLTAINHNSTA